MKAIIASFKPPAKPDDVKDVQASGFFVGGEKFVALRSDDSRLYGKKVYIFVFTFTRPILELYRILPIITDSFGISRPQLFFLC